MSRKEKILKVIGMMYLGICVPIFLLVVFYYEHGAFLENVKYTDGDVAPKYHVSEIYRTIGEFNLAGGWFLVRYQWDDVDPHEEHVLAEGWFYGRNPEPHILKTAIGTGKTRYADDRESKYWSVFLMSRDILRTRILVVRTTPRALPLSCLPGLFFS